MGEHAIVNELIPTAEAARLLSRTPDAVRVMARRGTLATALVLAGGQRLFRRRDVLAYRERREQSLATGQDTKRAKAAPGGPGR